MRMVSTSNYAALDTNAKEKIAAMYKKKMQYVHYSIYTIFCHFDYWELDYKSVLVPKQ